MKIVNDGMSFQLEQAKEVHSQLIARSVRASQTLEGTGWRVLARGAHRANATRIEMLIKMVRLHPTLRWLRSDLTEENVAMLKQERPDQTFLSD